MLEYKSFFSFRWLIFSFSISFFSFSGVFLITSSAVAEITPASSCVIGTYPTGGTSPQGIAFDSVNNVVWVANYTSDTVSEIAVTDGHLIATYSTGSGTQRPRAIAFDPVTPAIWVTNWYGDNFIKMSTDGSILRTYDSGYASTPLDIAYEPGTQSMWVTLGPSASAVPMWKVNISSGAVTTLPGLAGPFNLPGSITFDPINQLIWTVGAWVSRQPTGPGYDFPDIINSYYAPYRYYGFVTKIKNSITWSNYYTPYNTSSDYYNYAPIDSKYRGGIAYNPITQSVWETNTTYNNIIAISTSNGSILGRYNPVFYPEEGPARGNAPGGIVYDPSTQSMFVTGSNKTVTRMDATNGNVIDWYRVGSNPTNLTYDSYTNSIWVTNAGDNTVSKLCATPPTVPTPVTTFTGTYAEPPVQTNLTTLNLPVGGGSVDLNWSVTNAASGTCTGYSTTGITDWATTGIGDKPVTGTNVPVTVSSTTTFDLDCWNTSTTPWIAATRQSVVVNVAVPPSTLNICPPSAIISKGSTGMLRAWYDSAGSTMDCGALPSTAIDKTSSSVWSSNDTSFVTVNSSGTVTGVNIGSANVKATYPGTSGDTVKVDVICIETVTCDSERNKVCSDKTVPAGTTLTGICGTVDCSGKPGKRYCDYNYKEEAP